MRWEDERYVRLYTRNTVEWEMLPWESRCLWPLILRAVDRAGLLDLGKHGSKGLAALVKVPADFAETGLKGLLDDGCAELRGTVIVIPNFIEAQEATQSDAQRKRESRERARALANSEPVTNRDNASQNVTDSHENGQKVTNGHDLSQAVTSGHSVPNRAVPSVPSDQSSGSASPPASAEQLGLENQEPPKPAKKPESAELVAYFAAAWVKACAPADGKPPTLTAADRGQASQLVKKHGLDACKGYVDQYLADSDAFLVKTGYALKNLAAKVDAYRSRASPSPMVGHAKAAPHNTESRIRDDF